MNILREARRKRLGSALLASILAGLLVQLAACSRSDSDADDTPQTKPSTIKISIPPVDEIVAAGQAVTFHVAATGNGSLSYQWERNRRDIPGATSASYRIPPATAADNGASFRVIITDASSRLTSTPAKLTVIPAAPAVNVLTYHNDNLRTGQNLKEVFLTPKNVNWVNFGKLGFISVVGRVDAEPLYVSGLEIGGYKHNALIVATEHDLIYAFDADTFAELWQASLTLAGETPSDDRKCAQVSPEIGVTATPVIDLAAGAHGTIFAVAMSKDGHRRYFQRVHALDLQTGQEQRGSPATIAASLPGSGPNSRNGRVLFDPKQYKERASLLLDHGIVYTAWSSHCDADPYNSWVMGYDERTLRRAYVINLTPNGAEGGIWMSGDGPAADAAGNIYLLNGNGSFDTALDGRGFPSKGDFGNAIVKLTPSKGALSVTDYFTMHDVISENARDADLGSGGILLLPDLTDGSGKTRRLAIGAGKDWNVYVADRDNMGKFNPQRDRIYQELRKGLGGAEFAVPAYFNHTVYYGAYLTPVMAFPVRNGRLAAAPSSKTKETYDYPGAAPGISADGTENGIVWTVENSTSGILHAHDAANLAREFYDSNEAGLRDQFADNKFITPLIANGKVYVGTPTGVIVFGLLP